MLILIFTTETDINMYIFSLHTKLVLILTAPASKILMMPGPLMPGCLTPWCYIDAEVSVLIPRCGKASNRLKA